MKKHSKHCECKECLIDKQMDNQLKDFSLEVLLEQNTKALEKNNKLLEQMIKEWKCVSNL